MELSRPDSISLRPDARDTNRPDDQDRRSDARNLSACFRGSARPNGINTPSGRGPTEAIYTPGHRLSTLPHQNLPFWHLVNEFLQAFGIILLLFVFLCIFPHSRYSSSLFLFSLFLTVRMMISLGMFFFFALFVMILVGTTM